MRFGFGKTGLEGNLGLKAAAEGRRVLWDHKFKVEGLGLIAETGFSG